MTTQHLWTAEAAPRTRILERATPADLPADVAAFRADAGHAGAALPLDSDNFVVTQDAYILGFPYLQATTLEAGSPRRLPIVKKCIIAGVVSQEDGARRILIDTIANPGFSGGPLVYLDVFNGNTWKVAGVVGQQMSAPLEAPVAGEPVPPSVPAGLSVAHDIAALLPYLT